ncbi:nucleotide sugar dehydrogenase [Inediibacterium massiliense]|uniref:nucleotide sugar dehydrogenase n=1 Tax=Inediibacterium massiliense TaxID=1658111 RepID=UPI0006B514F6|nr:nucleotide sugar dehydrogenase [Inediibacterium massiliense]
MYKSLKEKFLDKSAIVSVIGLGYVGLPLAIAFAQAGYKVFGIDTSKDKIQSLQNGKSYILDISDEDLQNVIHKNLFVGDDFSVLNKTDAISICVPTPLNKTKDPDLSYLSLAIEKIIKFIKKGTLIILESTTYPGTTEELITKPIENNKKYKLGVDFFVCFSPERIDPGNKKLDIRNTPKIIGGDTSHSLELGTTYYHSIFNHMIPVTSTKVAEMTKLLENTFRSVNIALVNELTLMCERMNINIWEVIDAASTKPMGYMPFYPGPGIGGHCIPLDPMYLSWKGKTFDYYNRFIELANDINRNMPRYIVQNIGELLNRQEKSIKNSIIFLIGISYKKNTSDLRESPAIEIYKLLEEKGGKLIYHDPYVPHCKINKKIIYSQNITKENIKSADLIVITTDHNNIDYPFIIKHAKNIFDTRNVTKLYKNKKHITLLGTL